MLVKTQASSAWRNNLQMQRTHLQSQQAALKTQFFKHKNTAQLLKKQSLLIDNLLKQIWLQANIHAEVAVIAVGGYGRGELFPYSDIDLLILLPDAHDDALNKQIEGLIGQLWDIGLNVGHSVRNREECLSEAAKDVTVQTSLLEARLLAGNKINFQLFT